MAEEYSSTTNETETEGSSCSSSVLSLHYSSSPFEIHYEREREDPWQESPSTRITPSLPSQGAIPYVLTASIVGVVTVPIHSGEGPRCSLASLHSVTHSANGLPQWLRSVSHLNH